MHKLGFRLESDIFLAFYKGRARKRPGAIGTFFVFGIKLGPVGDGS